MKSLILSLCGECLTISFLYSVDLVNGTTPHVYLWTYGCPRVGNAAFANWFPGGSGVLNNQRVVNDKDIGMC